MFQERLYVAEINKRIEAEQQQKYKLKSDLLESRDQVELLEFQVLELEEEINGLTKCKPATNSIVDVGTMTEDISNNIVRSADSGCSSLEHSRSSSMSLDVEEMVEIGKDYRVNNLWTHCQFITHHHYIFRLKKSRRHNKISTSSWIM